MVVAMMTMFTMPIEMATTMAITMTMKVIPMLMLTMTITVMMPMIPTKMPKTGPYHSIALSLDNPYKGGSLGAPA